METISELRDNILEFYARIERAITPILKFILMFVSILMINGKLGFMDKLTNIIIVLAISLIAAFLPVNVSVIVSALFILGHLFELSIQVAAIVGLVFAVMFVLYFRFSPKDAVVVMLTPLLFLIKMPYLIALVAGFMCGSLAFVAVSCGTVVYYIVDYIGKNSDKFNASFSADNALSGFKVVIDNVISNDTMIVMVVTLAVVTVLMNVIKRMSFDYSWYVGLAVSSILGLIVVIIGSSAMDADVSIVGSIISMIISAAIAFVIQLFVHNVDYSQAEYVEFEDDEYYYYVKAIPRLSTGSNSPEIRQRPARRPER